MGKQDRRKEPSVEPLVTKREKDSIVSVEVKKEKNSLSEDPEVLFIEEGCSDLLSRSLNAAYKKMTGISSSANSKKMNGSSVKSLVNPDSLNSCKGNQTSENIRDEKRPKETAVTSDFISTYDANDPKKEKGQKITNGGSYPLENGLDKQIERSKKRHRHENNRSQKEARELEEVSSRRPGGRKSDANSLQVADFEHE